jgi:hypothetical protein
VGAWTALEGSLLYNMRTVRERTCCEEEEDAFATEQQDRNATQTRRTVANRDFMVIMVIVVVVVDIVIIKGSNTDRYGQQLAESTVVRVLSNSQ